MEVQEFRWENGATEPTDVCPLSTEMGTFPPLTYFLHERIILAFTDDRIY
jgi:hypothetical protein